ncbi:MAG: ribosome biogenesis GTP-binding protein YihA/YsxC [Bacteroidetes bacterium]|nr:ribosome biogenesis GTP-binding protein YihA/YsxC [Bacteroidota bacterium]MDA0888828.1 ribosome biogenesis GTP-binding protein YihA/YsxC [Bacteroidota bacterium]MDA1084591.1 ribosome biogenesis GTP-binding protein YihA/YsxC [Bacteroidota bacterium]
MRIKNARFVVSNSRVAQCPNTNLPEFAFIGRSNVGKSSLINMLTDRKKLAKTSGRPGKTQLINHFLINENWHLVDLPGYGYARVSKKNKKTFQQYITDYFLERKQLVNAFVLVDIRHEPQPIDVEFMEWMGTQQIPFAIIFTKADKLSERVIETTVTAYLNTLLEGAWVEAPPHFVTSSTSRLGKDAVLAYIETLL